MKKRTMAFGVLVIVAVVLAVTWKSIAFQVLLTRSSMRYPQALACAKLFCERIVASDAPTTEWVSSVDDRDRIPDKTNYFYSLKVHFTECQTTMANIRHARLWVFRDSPTNTLANFYYQRNAPYLQMSIQKVTPGHWKVRAFFPLNNCLFDPDLNNDGVLDQKDVELARPPTDQ